VCLYLLAEGEQMGGRAADDKRVGRKKGEEGSKGKGEMQTIQKR